jgi:hypothetical protein
VEAEFFAGRLDVLERETVYGPDLRARLDGVDDDDAVAPLEVLRRVEDGDARLEDSDMLRDVDLFPKQPCSVDSETVVALPEVPEAKRRASFDIRACRQ